MLPEDFVAAPFEVFEVALFEVWCFDVLGFELPVELFDGLQATKSPVEIKPISAIFAIVFISFSPKIGMVLYTLPTSTINSFSYS